MKKYIIPLLLILFSASIYLQAAVEIDFGMNNVTYNAFYASYLNPLEPESQPVLFTVTFRNTETQSVRFKMKTELTWNGNTLLNDEITTDRDLGAGESWNLTSREIFTQTSSYFSADFDFDDIINSSSELEDIIMNTGMFPNGVYQLKLIPYTGSSHSIDDPVYTFTFNIQSPTPVVLLGPGTLIGLPIAEIQESNPTFIWVSNLQDFTINVYELEGIPQAMLNAEAIANEEPYHTEKTTVTTFAYPGSAKPLEPGKLYAWQVTSPLSYPGSTEAEELKSEMFIFKIMSDEGIASGDDNNATGSNTVEDAQESIQAINYFLQVLPSDTKDEITNLMNSGYVPQSIINYQNDYKPINTLFDISELILSGEKTIQSATIE